MKTKGVRLSFALVVVLSLSGFKSQDEVEGSRKSYFHLSAPEVTVLEEVSDAFDYLAAQAPTDDCLPPRLKSEDSPIEDQFNSIVAIGEKVWKLIESGRPVVNFKAPLAHALPWSAICWTELERWRPPSSQLMQVAYRNGFGQTVVKFRFRVIYSSGGSLNGVGSYLANVTVLPETIDVAWGYTVNAETVVGRAINLGTRDNPIAGLQLMVTWNVKTIVKDSTASESIFLRAD